MIVLSGASASGKTEVAKLLAKQYGITKVITTTTREKRIGEINGQDYFFVSKERFEEMIKEDLFVEYTFYNGNYYGSTKAQIGPNKCIVIDLAGLKSYLALHDKEIVTIFLEATEETRFRRMLFRGDPIEKAKSRIENDKTAFDPKKIPVVDVHIDSETTNVAEATELVYDFYIKELKKRNL